MPDLLPDPVGVRRRLFLKGLALTPLAVAATPVLGSAPLAPSPAERFLVLSNKHTGEALETVYFRDGRYVPEALEQVDLLLRDFRTEDVYPIDPALLDTLFSVCVACGGERFEIVSAYRSPKTNAMLRRRNRAVARDSLHMSGRAIDVRLVGRSTAKLRDAALALKSGGVGYYPRSNFVHLDTGHSRYWRGR